MKQTLTKTVASALSFAHLSSVRKGARAEGDKPKDDDDEAKAEGDDDKPKDDDDKSAKGKAEGDDDKPKDDDDKSAKGKAEGDDDKPKDDDDKSAKGKAEDDEDSDEEMRGNSAAAAARRRERARCAAIFASAAAGKNPVLAANLAFKTSMSRSEAISILEGTPAASAPDVSTATRASRSNPNLGVPPVKSASKTQQTASSWDAALKAANPAVRRG